MPPEPPAPRKGEHRVPWGVPSERCPRCGADIAHVATASNRLVTLSMATLVRRDGGAYALCHGPDCEAE